MAAMVIVLIRSKLLKIQESQVRGGEAVYNAAAIARHSRLRNDSRTKQRSKFLDRNIGAAFAIPTYSAPVRGADQSIDSRSFARVPKARGEIKRRAVKSQQLASA